MKEKLQKIWGFIKNGVDVTTLGIIGLIIIGILLIIKLPTPDSADVETDIPTEYIHTVYLIVKEETNEDPVESESVVEETEEQGYQFTEEEINLIARLTYAEAGNQSELGKRLVIDVVLNRLGHPNFPDTVYDVIYQENQFSPATSGSIDLYSATEEIIQLVKEEIERRTDHDVFFFRASHYGNYGTPMYSVGNHYFSSYD